MRGIAQVEGHERKLEQTEWSREGNLLHIVRVYWNLVISTYQSMVENIVQPGNWWA
jgi:hypothetical protein